MTWTVATIKTKVRALTGRPNTSQLSDADLLDFINEYYVNHFPYDAGVMAEQRTFFTLGLTSADDGNYGLASNVIGIEPPITVKDSDDVVYAVDLHTDAALFFSLYPDDAHDETSERDRPRAVLLLGRDLYVRPKPDDSYTLKMAGRKGITAFTGDTDEPGDDAWALAICYGAAGMILIEAGDLEEAAGVALALKGTLTNINAREAQQFPPDMRAAPRF